jgi:hypothetical protein
MLEQVLEQVLVPVLAYELELVLEPAWEQALLKPVLGTWLQHMLIGALSEHTHNKRQVSTQ